METKQAIVNKKYLLEKYPGKGGWTYASIPEILQDKHSPFGWVEVSGFIDHFEIKNYKLMPAGKGKLFLPVKAEIRKKIGKQQGDWVHVILFSEQIPLDIRQDLLLCLMDVPAAFQTFMSYSDEEQNEYLNWIKAAWAEEIRLERIVKTIDRLSLRKKFKDK